MAIEKPMTPSNVVTITTDDEPDLEVEVIDPDAVTVTDDDGSVAIVLDSEMQEELVGPDHSCLLYTSPSPRDRTRSRMPSSA